MKSIALPFTINIGLTLWSPDSKRFVTGSDVVNGKTPTLNIFTICKWSDRTNNLFCEKIREKIFFSFLYRKIKTRLFIPIELWLVIFEFFTILEEYFIF
jgi:hypothetical protein